MATVNPDVVQRFQKAHKLPTRQEGDGHEIQVEVREDEEQTVKLQEIIDILVAAGYFRARIKGLSPFDKVVGGMTWCIESCSVDLDVDLLFRENSTIGQKIALTEKIVSVLPKMHCPHRIEPHQIQGLDFIHIFPVIQWLVKRSMEMRQESSAFVRSCAVNNFQKDFPLTDKGQEVRQKQCRNVNAVLDKYKPQRYYKRKNTAPQDLNSRVQVTLLEYGDRGRDLSMSAKEEQLEEKQERKIQQLLNAMSVAPKEITETDLNEAEKRDLSKHYESLHSELKDGGQKTRQETQIQQLEQQKTIIKDSIQNIQENIHKNKQKHEEINKELQEIQHKQKEFDQQLQELENEKLDSTDISINIKEAEELVKLSDNLRQEEQQFKKQCKIELGRLQTLIEETKKANSKPIESSDNYTQEITEWAEKVRLGRLKLAKKTRQVCSLQRQIDEIPGRAEITQYQKRFLELYNQMSSKHKETKQYYTLYNTLEDSRMYMRKELNLLNSISDNYPEAMQSSTSKQEFLNQFQAIFDGVHQSKVLVERKLQQEKAKKDALSQHLHNLLELQRNYVHSVRQLAIECRKQENIALKTT